MKEVGQTFNKGDFIFDYLRKNWNLSFLMSKKEANIFV